MDRANRPQGRDKKTSSSGGGNAKKRGSGQGVSKPVGSASGYSDRKEQDNDKGLVGDLAQSVLTSALSQQSQQSSSSNGSLLSSMLGSSGSSGSSGNSGNSSPFGSSSSSGCSGKSFKRIIIIVLLILAVLVIWKLFFAPKTGTQGSPSGFGVSEGSSQSVSETITDTGAYAADMTVASAARDRHTVIKGNGADRVTVMIYMCATDLESKYGMATADLQEILSAKLSDKVKVIIETGGTTKWQNQSLTAGTNQRFLVRDGKLEVIDDDMGRKSMVNPNTLTDFIAFCSEHFPADRNILILWDHGGGSNTGYGYDQHFPGKSMTLAQLNDALDSAKTKFDFIGFDACLMATLETAVAVEPFADYLVASEETEPGYGWYYTDWLSALSRDTSMSTVTLGKQIIDDFIRVSREKSPYDPTTLSLMDLAEFAGTVPAVFSGFSESTGELIDKDEYKVVSDARAGAKEFAASSQINQIDLIDFAKGIGTAEADALISALDGCIKYNRFGSSITDANGVSIYFPYTSLTTMDTMIKTYNAIGMDKAYTACIRSFASMAAGGQITSSASGGLLDVLGGNFTDYVGTGSSTSGASGGVLGSLLTSFLGSGDLSSFTADSLASSWIDDEKMSQSADYYAENRIDASAFELETKLGNTVFSLSEKEWSIVQTLELNIFLDDGEGYIDLGMDNVFEFNKDGDLIMDYDGTWMALDGQIVSYYLISDERAGDDYIITGRVPALLNGELVDLIVVFTDEDPDGSVTGARINYGYDLTQAQAKGLIELNRGDTIDFLCDYYAYNGDFEDSYFLGEQMVYDGDLDVTNASVGGDGYIVTYRITDIYANTYWTPALVY